MKSSNSVFYTDIGNVISYPENQYYSQIKADLLSRVDSAGACSSLELFSDTSFEPPAGEVWLRPGEINVEQKTNYNDGNPQFSLAIMAFRRDSKAVTRVIPLDNTFHSLGHGIYHFRIWRFGRWTEVVVDARLPTEKGTARLKYTKPENNDYRWALLEKAYAKLLGSYEALKHVKAIEILQDLTGGITHTWEKSNGDLDRLKNFPEHDMMITETKNMNPKMKEPPLVHLYEVIRFDEIVVGGLNVQYVVLKNHWPIETKWLLEQPQYKCFPEWRKIPKKALPALKLKEELKRGEFCLRLSYFREHFRALYTCESQDKDVEYLWNITSYHGEWTSSTLAGDDGKVVQKNPEFKFVVESAIESVIISLTQEPEEHSILPINLFIHPFSIDRTEIDARTYREQRDISYQFDLERGSYTIYPTRQLEGSEAKFLLRIFRKQERVSEEHQLLFSYSMAQMKELFKKHDICGSNTISLSALYQILTESVNKNIRSTDCSPKSKNILKSLQASFRKKVFSSESCEMFISMFNRDDSKTISLDNFVTLVGRLAHWTSVYKQYTAERCIMCSNVNDFIQTVKPPKTVTFNRDFKVSSGDRKLEYVQVLNVLSQQERMEKFPDLVDEARFVMIDSSSIEES